MAEMCVPYRTLQGFLYPSFCTLAPFYLKATCISFYTFSEKLKFAIFKTDKTAWKTEMIKKVGNPKIKNLRCLQ